MGDPTNLSTDSTTAGLTAALTRLGLELPPVAPPLAAYIPARRTGNLVITSGQLPLVDGNLTLTGVVAEDNTTPPPDPYRGFITADEAYQAARTCALNALAAAASVLAHPDQIVGVVQVVGYVVCAPGFSRPSVVLNGASDLFLELFGDAGRHARSAIGVATLPLDAPVELELTVAVSD